MGRRLFLAPLLMAAVVCVLSTPRVCAQGAGIAVESHGWVSGFDPERGGGVLLHLSPRSLPGNGVVGEAGQAWAARVLDTTPRSVPDWGRRVYLIYSRDTHLLDVFAIDVVRPITTGAWQTRPLAGANALPSLDMGGAEYFDAVGSSHGLLVLCRDQAWSLWNLAGREWDRVEMPPVIESAEHVWAVEDADPPRLVSAIGSSLTAWDWDMPRGEEVGRWTPTELNMPEGITQTDLSRVVGAFATGRDVALAMHNTERNQIVVYTLGANLAGVLATIKLEGTPVSFEPLDGGRRMATLCEVVDPAAEGIANPIRTLQLIETSLVTGREMYRGSPRSSTLSIDDGLRLLSLGMMALSACVLFYLLRPVSEVADPVLPEGWVLAPPGRRVFAAVFDAWLVVGVVGLTLGVPFGEFVLFLPLLESARGVVALATVILGGAVYSTVAEWLLGCTFGKAIARLRVVSVDPARPTLGLMRCGARNVFRWALAPWALLGLGSPDFRHRGDVLTGAAVVTRPLEPSDSPDSGPS